ncbi:MAG: DUF1697 domain-containing protein [Actinobacteria bacterium]|nr:DUF1697 domain-containing protein [Actinomycetota bacterium]
MATYVAFLRAINLGATRKFPKDDIVAATRAAGFEDVATHINTGNVRISTRMRSRARIEAALEAAYLADRGFEVPTIVYAGSELCEVHEHASTVDHAGQHYVALLRDEPTDEGVQRLREKAQPGERIEVGGRAVHLLVSEDGVHGTKLTNTLVEKCLGTTSTWRNPTVVAALVEKWC